MFLTGTEEMDHHFVWPAAERRFDSQRIDRELHFIRAGTFQDPVGTDLVRFVVD